MPGRPASGDTRSGMARQHRMIWGHLQLFVKTFCGARTAVVQFLGGPRRSVGLLVL